MAEVMKYEDFKEFGNENAVKVVKKLNEVYEFIFEIILGGRKISTTRKKLYR